MLPFTFPSLLAWGLPLIGLPILIHLINMMRHRRVRWAAMEFLMQSQKQHRTWIMLKQLLLLLLRMTAVAAVVMMLAQPVLRRNWGAMLGTTQAHHIVLFDDSFSMSDRWGDTTAFNEAKKAIKRLADQAARERVSQKFTLLRFSKAGRLAVGSQPDMLREPVDGDFGSQFDRLLSAMQVSETAVGPAEALAALERLPASPRSENSIVYIVSDFRAREWGTPTVLTKHLARVQQNGSQIHLVACTDLERPNLAVTDLQVVSGVRAAGVPLTMSVSVRNFGPAAARNLSVRLEEDGHARPGVTIEEIPAGKTVTRRFASEFATAGAHRVAARLETDPILIDNGRYAVVQVTQRASVLLVDGSLQGEDSFFVAAALEPGGVASTGLKAQIESPAVLRTADLSPYETIFLLNVDRLGDRQIEDLEKYVRSGGGLAIFLGERSEVGFYNEKMYRDGKGSFPLPLVGSEQLLVDRLEKSPDLEVTDHPIFSVFAGERNSFITSVNVERYFAAPQGWTPPERSGVKVIARLRNGAPLAVEKQFGAGRMVAVLTKASPVETPVGKWNNWAAGNPSYVVAMLEMQAYLARGRHKATNLGIGDPIEVRLAPGQYSPKVRFTVPGARGSEPVTVDGTVTSSSIVARLPNAESSGIYQAQLTRLSGETEVRDLPVNVSPQEGDLRIVDAQGLAARLKGLRYQYHRASELGYDVQQIAGFNLSGTLLAVLIAILLLEQLVAYTASYHVRAAGGAAR